MRNISLKMIMVAECSASRFLAGICNGLRLQRIENTLQVLPAISDDRVAIPTSISGTFTRDGLRLSGPPVSGKRATLFPV